MLSVAESNSALESIKEKRRGQPIDSYKACPNTRWIVLYKTV